MRGNVAVKIEDDNENIKKSNYLEDGKTFIVEIGGELVCLNLGNGVLHWCGGVSEKIKNKITEMLGDLAEPAAKGCFCIAVKKIEKGGLKKIFNGTIRKKNGSCSCERKGKFCQKKNLHI